MSQASIEGFPLSPQQEHLWTRTGGQGALCSVALVHLRGELREECLEGALEDLVERHEILRTTFHLLPGMKVPLQVAGEASPARRFVDLGERPEEEHSAALVDLLEAARSRSLEWEKGPLFESVQIRLGRGQTLLLLSLPTLCCDAAGLGNLVAELTELYGARVARTEGAKDEEEGLQYIDLAEWQNELLESEEAEEGKAFWRGRTAPTPGVRLPATVAASSEGEALGFHHGQLSTAQVQQLRSLAERLRVAPTDVLHAAWTALLWRLSGTSESLTLARALDGRKFDELEGLPGLFLRHVPLRSKVAGTFEEWVGELAAQVEECREWQEYFSWRLLAAEGEDPPYPQWAFTDYTLPEATEGGGITFTVERITVAAEPFALELVVSEGRAAWDLDLRFDPDRVEPQEASRLLERFRHLLDAAVAEPQRSVAEFSLVGEAERRLLLDSWNATTLEYDPPHTLHGRVAEQARRNPERVAVESEEGCLTHGALRRRVLALAGALREAGVGPEVRVALCLEPSLDLVAAYLAIFEAGGAYVPLDPAYPDDRLAAMLEDARPALLLTHRGLAEDRDFGEAEVRLFDLDAFDSQRPTLPEGAGAGPDDLAYVLFTSGSTGRPKGVMVRQGAITHRLMWMERLFPLAESDRLLQKTATSFDASIWEFFVPLMAGARLVLASPGEAQDPSYLARTTAVRRITVLQLVPSLLRVFLVQGGMGSFGLRRVFCGGEALPGEVADRLRERLSGVELVNLYGPTECAIDVSCHPVSEEVGRVGVLPIGRPIDNLRIYLLNRWGVPVPVGQAGEVHAAGAGLARGYFERPGQTARSFVPDPFSAEPGGRLYRTGDLCRHRGDGVLEFLGRIDHQVKVRGFRIELGEVESWLGRHPAVAEVAAVVRDGEGGPRLLAYAVLGEDPPEDGAAILRRHLEEHLPHYMVPGHIVLLETMPRTPNGKVDRRALPEPELFTDGASTPPRTPTEEMLAAAWGEILGVEGLGRDDNVFELGWHSLMATQLISRLRRLFGVELSLRSAFEAPTVAELAVRIDAAVAAGAGLEVPPMEPAERGGPLDLSFAQYRLWFLDTLQPGSSFYNVPVLLELSGALEVGVLAASLGEIHRRHESLRTIFRNQGGEPEQVIQPPGPMPLPVVDLSALGERSEAEAHRLVGEEVSNPFDLARGPLLRALLLRLSTERHFGVLVMHHIVSDGWSTAILTQELGALYGAFRKGQPSPLEELPWQYADFAAWQRRWLRGEVLEAQISYWRLQLEDAPPLLQLPTDHARPEEQRYRGATRSLALPTELGQGLRGLAREEGATLFMVLLAAGSTLLGWYAGQDDVVIGTDVANRNRSEVEGIIGFFINQLALRTRLDGDPDFRELLARVRRTTFEAQAHQDLPFDKLVEALNPGRALGHSPIFQAKINLINVPSPELRLGELEISSLGTPRTTAQFDWILNLFETGDGLAAWVEYDTDLFEADTIDRMLAVYRELLDTVVDRPEQRSSELAEVLEEADSRWRLEARKAKKGTLRGKLRKARRRGVGP